MKTELDNRILVVCDIGETADALLRAVDSLFGSVEGRAPELLKTASFKIVPSADVAKLKYHFQSGTCPVGIVLVSENKSSSAVQPTGSTNNPSKGRSLEGIVCELAGTFSRTVFQRTVVLGNRLDHPTLRLLAEFGIRTAQLLENLRSPDEAVCHALLDKLFSVIASCSASEHHLHWLDDEKLASHLENWESLAGSEKAMLEESLRGSLGAELFGQIAELQAARRNNPETSFVSGVVELLNRRAEQVSAQNLLAALHIQQGDCGGAVQTFLRLNTLS
ncbi:hypothetical protein EBR21_12640, partial [bacterium]|nr:hypothetical protein [bacterium]